MALDKSQNSWCAGCPGVDLIHVQVESQINFEDQVESFGGLPGVVGEAALCTLGVG
ncbi:MAG: hypothetical protein WEE36_10010 [Acidimicrobiia bacterium]